MANISVNQYFHLIQAAFDEKRGEHAAALLSIKDPHVMNYRLHMEHPENLVQNFLECPYDELVAAHLKCCWAVNNHDFIKAYQCQVIGVQTFTKIFQAQKEENWALPIMYSLAVDLRMLANNADLELSKSSLGKPGETLEKSAELLMGCFRICAADNRSAEEDTKRLGMLNLVNQLFKIYFKINKLHLCKPLIRAIESSQFKDTFSLSQQVTYRYYVGRKAMFDSDFKNAEEYLSYAFKRCHRLCKRNKRLILIYLIPVKMLLGHMPKESLLRKYDLLQFLEVAQSVKEGNLLHLTRALDRHERFFIKCGIFLILEKLKIITYRNLFKKVCMLMKSFQISVDVFYVALKLMEVPDVDLDETNCILANLIYEGKIKGYLSYQHQKLVISKQNAFPPLSGAS